MIGNKWMMAAAAAAFFLVSAAAEENWIQDARTGCAVWNPNPVPGEVVVWLGDCVDGKSSGKGLLTYTLNGKLVSSYEGEERGGKHHGFGIVTFADGRRLETNWRNGFPTGEGVMIMPDGRRIKLIDGKPLGE